MGTLKATAKQMREAALAKKADYEAELQLQKIAAEEAKGILEKQLQGQVAELKKQYAAAADKHTEEMKNAEIRAVQNALGSQVKKIQAKARQPLEAKIEELKTEMK